MPSGDHVTRFRLHVPDPGKRVLPLPVCVWDKLARKGCDRLVKGDAVLVRGHLVRRFFRPDAVDLPPQWLTDLIARATPED